MAVTTEKEDHGHPSTDHTRRFPIDQLLRRHGWRIWQRFGNLQPLWERIGTPCTQEEALRSIGYLQSGERCIALDRDCEGKKNASGTTL